MWLNCTLDKATQYPGDSFVATITVRNVSRQPIEVELISAQLHGDFLLNSIFASEQYAFPIVRRPPQSTSLPDVIDLGSRGFSIYATEPALIDCNHIFQPSEEKISTLPKHIPPSYSGQLALIRHIGTLRPQRPVMTSNISIVVVSPESAVIKTELLRNTNNEKLIPAKVVLNQNSETADGDDKKQKYAGLKAELKEIIGNDKNLEKNNEQLNVEKQQQQNKDNEFKWKNLKLNYFHGLLDKYNKQMNYDKININDEQEQHDKEEDEDDEEENNWWNQYGIDDEEENEEDDEEQINNKGNEIEDQQSLEEKQEMNEVTRLMSIYRTQLLSSLRPTDLLLKGTCPDPNEEDQLKLQQLYSQKDQQSLKDTKQTKFNNKNVKQTEVLSPNQPKQQENDADSNRPTIAVCHLSSTLLHQGRVIDGYLEFARGRNQIDDYELDNEYMNDNNNSNTNYNNNNTTINSDHKSSQTQLLIPEKLIQNSKEGQINKKDSKKDKEKEQQKEKDIKQPKKQPQGIRGFISHSDQLLIKPEVISLPIITSEKLTTEQQDEMNQLVRNQLKVTHGAVLVQITLEQQEQLNISSLVRTNQPQSAQFNPEDKNSINSTTYNKQYNNYTLTQTQSQSQLQQQTQSIQSNLNYQQQQQQQQKNRYITHSTILWKSPCMDVASYVQYPFSVPLPADSGTHQFQTTLLSVSYQLRIHIIELQNPSIYAWQQQQQQPQQQQTINQKRALSKTTDNTEIQQFQYRQQQQQNNSTLYFNTTGFLFSTMRLANDLYSYDKQFQSNSKSKSKEKEKDNNNHSHLAFADSHRFTVPMKSLPLLSQAENSISISQKSLWFNF